MGDSIGWWDGDTLVVETINYHPAQSIRGSGPKLKVTEKFTRVAADRLLYQFTVEDPDTWAQPWSGEYEFASIPGDVYEYACHEGNYGLQNILGGTRRGSPGGGGRECCGAVSGFAPARDLHMSWQRTVRVAVAISAATALASCTTSSGLHTSDPLKTRAAIEGAIPVDDDCRGGLEDDDQGRLQVPLHAASEHQLPTIRKTCREMSSRRSGSRVSVS